MRYFSMIAALLFSLSATQPVFAQRSQQLGITVANQLLTEDLKLKPFIGIVYEQRFTNRSGIEATLSYSTDRTKFGFNFPDHSYTTSVYSRFVGLSASYKFYTRLVNLSVGPYLNKFVSWKQRDNLDSVTVNNFERSPELTLGMIFKVSRPIPLNEHLVLEPEFRFTNRHGVDFNEYNEASFGVSLKYEF